MPSNEKMRKAMAEAIAVLQAGLVEDEPPAVEVPPIVEIPPVVVEPPAKAITRVVVQSTSDKTQTDVPITFGQVFAPGDLPAGKGLKDMQLDVKATHPDGSVRHAVVSTILPQLEPGKDVVLELVPEINTIKKSKTLKPVDMGLVIVLTINGEAYYDLSLGKDIFWAEGPIMFDMLGTSILADREGREHPHLSARTSARWYPEAKSLRVEVVIENTWAYEPAPQNFTYDVEIVIAGRTVASHKNLTHYHHARWRTVAWVGEEPKVHIKHDTAYLIASKALPNYDQSLTITEKTLADWAVRWAKAPKEPMTVGLSVKGMAMTGGRPDIGILPAWSALYLLSMDKRLEDAMLGTADLAGTWSMHYRDKETDRPISLIDYPYMTIKGIPTDTKNPATKKQEAFPKLVKGADKTPFSHDSAHQPGFSYLPYLLTGDYYHLEELQFWAMYNVLQGNPGREYRSSIKGLVMWDQVRGQAWSLRTLGQAAYITPDNDRLKQHFLQILDSNLDWYNAEYSNNPEANKLGVFVHKSAIVYRGNTAVAPWQDDFVTAVAGYLVDLGFEKARPFLKWKAQFAIGRMIGEGVDWRAAANYTYQVRATEASPLFSSVGDAFRELVRVGQSKDGSDAEKDFLRRSTPNSKDMGGYPSSTEGFPANMQPALAYAATYAGPDGVKAWAKFETRSPKPNYGTGPQFAIVPRSL